MDHGELARNRLYAAGGGTGNTYVNKDHLLKIICKTQTCTQVYIYSNNGTNTIYTPIYLHTVVGTATLTKLRMNTKQHQRITQSYNRTYSASIQPTK